MDAKDLLESFVKSGPLPKQIMPQALNSDISYTDIVVHLYRIVVLLFMNNLNRVSVEKKQTCTRELRTVDNPAFVQKFGFGLAHFTNK